MNDTPKHILEKQFEIINSIPLSDRILSLVDLTDLSRSIIYNQLAKKHPDFTEIDLKIELFKTFYKSDFDSITIELIAQSMKDYLVSNSKRIEKT